MNCLLKGVRTLWPFMGGLRLSLPSKAEAPPFLTSLELLYLGFAERVVFWHGWGLVILASHVCPGLC